MSRGRARSAQFSEALEAASIKQDVLVEVVGQHAHVRMALQHRGERTQLVGRIHGAGGLDGELSISRLVRGVIAASSSPAVSLKPFSDRVVTQMGTPSANSVMIA